MVNIFGTFIANQNTNPTCMKLQNGITLKKRTGSRSFRYQNPAENISDIRKPTFGCSTKAVTHRFQNLLLTYFEKLTIFGANAELLRS